MTIYSNLQSRPKFRGNRKNGKKKWKTWKPEWGSQPSRLISLSEKRREKTGEKGVPQGRRPWLGPRGPAAAGFLRLNCRLACSCNSDVIRRLISYPRGPARSPDRFGGGGGFSPRLCGGPFRP